MVHLAHNPVLRLPRRKLTAGLAIILFGLATGWVIVVRSDGGHRVFPGEAWETLTPENAGMDPERLDAFVDFVQGSGCIVRHGRMVWQWGHVDHPFDIASAVKPVYAHLVYMAIADGKLESLDEPVARYKPELCALNPDLKNSDHAITWRHLVTQTACYGVAESPGSAFDYSDYQSALLIDTLVINVYETGYDQVDEKLLEPLLSTQIGCQDSPTMNSQRSHPGRLRISPRDLARFGLLYLSGGKWGSRRVVPEDLAIQAVSSPHPPSLPRTEQQPAERLPAQRSIGAGENQEEHLGGYSYMWWLNRQMEDGTQVLPDAPIDLFCAIGHAGGDALVILPSLDVVLCWVDGLEGNHARRFSTRGRVRVNRALRRFMESLQTTTD